MASVVEQTPIGDWEESLAESELASLADTDPASTGDGTAQARKKSD